MGYKLAEGAAAVPTKAAEAGPTLAAGVDPKPPVQAVVADPMDLRWQCPRQFQSRRQPCPRITP
jgi:hypothetical protein